MTRSHIYFIFYLTILGVFNVVSSGNYFKDNKDRKERIHIKLIDYQYFPFDNIQKYWLFVGQQKIVECCHVLKLSANTEGNGFQAQMAGMGFYIQNPLKSPNDYAAFTKPATRSFPSRSIMMDKRSGWKVRVLIRREWVELK